MLFKSIRTAALAALPASALLGVAPALAQGPVVLDAFCQNLPRPPFETRSNPDPMTTIVNTASGPDPLNAWHFYPPGNSFGPHPTNLLPTVYENAKTCRGNEIPNTLSSTPDRPYNLHDDPVVTPIDKTSPTDDLDTIMDRIEAMSSPHRVCRRFRHGREYCFDYPRRADYRSIASLAQDAVDIIEGNPLNGWLAGRAYQGFPILHYLGGLKTKAVDPATKSVTINQIWYDTHIESDTNYIDPTVVNDEEWTIHYNVKILNRGHEDFAPFAVFFDDPKELNLTDLGGPDLTKGGTVMPRVPSIALDQTFFPMEEGLQYSLNMKMPPARFWNLTYHWGWRIHPPRVQVTENVLVPLGKDANGNPRPRNFAEIGVFGANPRASEQAKLDAIEMIGDTAPSKRMWRMFRELAGMNTNRPAGYGHRRGHHRHGFRGLNGGAIQAQMEQIRQAFYDWQNRNKLPTGYTMADGVDVTLVFLNNTIYGHLRGHDGRAAVRMPGDHSMFTSRGDSLSLQIMNGDYYDHTYVPVDFGGLRGWENTFHNTLPLGGAGPLFTFGRAGWWVNVAGQGPIPIPPATRPAQLSPTPLSNPQLVYASNEHGKRHDWMEHIGEAWGGLQQNPVPYVNTDGVGEHHVIVNFNYDPSRRLRMYQFDALHHDEAIWSMH